ncbi:hypothetical protein K491DRAFT_764656 [Lophiostoma macrostomum CBS 122681]|uniref:DUF7492 domain-containing protein n=1 Tax=Lophiostoma macrostomum CBS 122681 TaxID=1314788 RepID=A0A6A6TPN2_9PLEO|nr:hypothetical protein K491DRAFT_764656 [Lophiostoma macrostomum CBS 122681]
MMHFPTSSKAFVALLVTLPGVLGHTWIEQLRSIDDQGQYVGEYGYPRGMFAKTDPGYDGTKMNWQLPGVKETSFPFISANSTLCHPSQQKQQQSQEKYPRLQAKPGSFIAMRYMENGHITKSAVRIGKPEKGGTVYVYGTTQPKEDEKLANILQWTQDGQGGDKRGKIVAMNNFDDGRCYEVSSQPDSVERQKATPNFAMGQADSGGPGNYPLFCETNVAIPKEAATGSPYTLYWVWQWATEPKKDPGLPNGQDEYYTTCVDIDVVDQVTGKAEAQFALGQQDAMSKAVSDYQSRTAILTNAMSFEMGPVFSGSQTQSGSAPPSQQTSGAPQPSSNVAQPTSIALSSSAPYTNATSSSGGSLRPDIPTLTRRPDDGNPAQTDAPQGGDQVTVTVTTMITKTAAAITQTIAARAEHVARHGSKFRRGSRISPPAAVQTSNPAAPAKSRTPHQSRP